MPRALTFVCGLLALPAFAETNSLSITQDHCLAGVSIRFDGPVVSDFFIAGNVVSVLSPAAGVAHLAGPWVSVDAAVAGNL